VPPHPARGAGVPRGGGSGAAVAAAAVPRRPPPPPPPGAAAAAASSAGDRVASVAVADVAGDDSSVHRDGRGVMTRACGCWSLPFFVLPLPLSLPPTLSGEEE
jgi:hypothetical protein